ncbi:MAG: RiPP maturation radical SAM protein 1 [Desulfarculus sp.]|nr:RiPP maturation radical SAM protein 1 [Desulfarculus sp.]
MGLDCCLVLMPYADLRAPSLGLGLLQAALRQEGLTARTVYANLDFAEATGLALPERVMKAGRWLLGEWSFARAAFPEHARRDQEYLDFLYQRWVLRYPPRARRIQRAYFHDRALDLRQQAEAFLEDLVQRLADLEPRVVGCSSTFQQHVASLALLRRLRDKAPQVISLLGGANCEGTMGLATHRAFPWVDYLVSGEADGIMAPLVRGLLAQGRGLRPTDLPVGVLAPAHRQEGYPAAGPDKAFPRAVLAGLDQAPPPDYGDFFARLEQSPALKAALDVSLPFETSRGCWWAQQPGGGCTFCGLNGMEAGQRRKSPSLALAQMQGLLDSYPARKVRMSDNMLPPDYYKTFLPRLAQAPWRGQATFFYETRSALSRQQVAALRQAGVIWIQPGVESLDSRCLALINKGCQAWQHVQTLKWCLHQGVRATWHLLFGFPGEQDAWYHDMAGLLPLLHHLQSPTMLMPFNYDRFSLYQSQPARYGLELAPIADYAHVYPLPPAQLAELAYLWQDPAQEAYALNPLAPYLGHGGGLEALERAFLAWRRAFLLDNPRAELGMRDTPQGLEITDTREGRRHWRLTGLERQVYLACDEAPPRQALLEGMAGAGHATQAVLAVLDGLLASRLLVELDGRVLALAVAEPLHPYPELTDHPAGMLRFSGEDGA